VDQETDVGVLSDLEPEIFLIPGCAGALMELLEISVLGRDFVIESLDALKAASMTPG
jgi:hypothetical protein